MSSRSGPAVPAGRSIERTVERIRSARAEGKRIALWGAAKDVLEALLREDQGGLAIVLMEPVTLPGAFTALAPAELRSYAPDEVHVIDPRGALAVFEALVRDHGFTPLAVVLPDQVWDDRFAGVDPELARILERIPSTIAGGLSSPEVVIHLYDAVRHVLGSKIPGRIVNLGVFQGWSLYFLGLVLEARGALDREIVGLDTFQGFPRDVTANDVFCEYQNRLGKTGWNFFKNTSREEVAARVSRFPSIRLIEGDVRETVPALDDAPIALALFDMDDYTPTRAALEPIYARLSPGGVMVQDHFAPQTLCAGACFGQRLAVLEFLERHPMYHLAGTNVFLKTLP